MPRPFLLVVAAFVALAACGKNRDLPPPGPIPREVYEVAESDVPPAGRYLRYVEPGPKGGGLDIAITDFGPPSGKGPTISLVGVVHVADAPYYERVQRILDGYDVVLYEGVSPKGLSGGEWQRKALEKSGEAGAMQREIAEWFGFRYQLDAIDYSRRNLVHADMDLETFVTEGGARFGLVPEEKSETKPHGDANGSPLTPDVRKTWDAIREFGRLALGTPGPLQSLARKMIAETMGTADIGTSLDLVPGLSELILTKRNAIVEQTLRVQLSKRENGTIAVFYGAAHMPDLAERITSKLGYRRLGGRWLRAWGLRPPVI